MLKRLKERKLVQWALAYLAGAWLVLQVLDLLADAFAWPIGVQQIAIVLLGVGFFAALVLAWYHGEKGAQRVSGAEIGMLAGILAMAGVGVAWVGGRSEPASDERSVAAATPIDTMPMAEQGSVAVLPFVNLSADEENEYFSDGITEEILNALAQVPGLKVSARTSAFQFKDKAVDVREVAQKLGVAHVLEGSVQRSGDRVRITAQLISAKDGYHLWSQRYDREMKDVFAVQDEISQAVVEALKVRLTAGSAVAGTQATESVKAHELYLRGLYHWNRRRAEDLELAVRYFEQAIAEDPSYARAHAGLALTYAVMPTTTLMDRPVSTQKGKAAAQRALELDPALAEAYAALGAFAEQAWDWPGAERSYTRAVELNPSLATAHQWRAELFQIQGRLEESRRDIQRALQLDPLSLIINYIAAKDYMYRGEYDPAIAQLHRTLELDPSFERALGILMDVHVLRSEFDQAAEVGRRLAEVSGDPPEMLETLARGRQSPAHRAAALRVLADADVQRTLGPMFLAMGYALADERDAALAAAARAVEANHPLAPKILIHPLLRKYRSDPRYIRLRQQMGLS